MKRKTPIFDKTNIIILVVLAVIAMAVAFLAFRLGRSIISTWTITNLEGLPVGSGGSESSNPGDVNNELSNKPSIRPVEINPEPWDGVSRITILLMGLDYRDWEAGEVPRTDSMMVITLDPVAGEAALLSIPRDMWVAIPGFDYNRINTAYRFGEVYQLPGGGPGLAVETVEEFLGVPIDYYAQIDFLAFVKVIDEIKGVTVRPKTDVKIIPIGGQHKQTLKAGEVYTLDGELTLAYARARYTEGGDFDRAARQQEVAFAIFDRIIKFSMWPTLFARAPVIYQEISSGIHTNMNFEDALKLATLALELDRSKIKSFIIDASYIEFGKSPQNEDILKPIPDRIRVLRDEVFSTGGPLSPAAIKSQNDGNPVTLEDLVKLENATVSIRNGSWYSGLAAETAAYLRTKNFNIVEETNADATDVSLITLYNAKPYTIQAIFKLFEDAGLGKPRLINRYDPNASPGIIFILGNDWANYVSANPLPTQ
jgi:LCP family protein required for cell wall assembly